MRFAFSKFWEDKYLFVVFQIEPMSKNKIRSLSGSHGCLTMGSKDFWSAEKSLNKLTFSG